MTLYREDLARIQKEAFGGYAEKLMPRVLAALGPGNGGKVLDIGCGAGLSARLLLESGFEVIALEQSEAMLAFAREEAPRASFTCRSVWDAPPPRADHAIAIGEPLLYQPRSADPVARFKWLFEELFKSLPAGGKFVFDILDREGAPLDAKRFQTHDEWVLLSETVEDRAANRITRFIDTFLKIDALEIDAWRREHEVHELVCLSRTEVTQWLDAAGFDATMVDANPELPRRVLVTATRRA
ncbi:MAG: class I SAM-dependent methyltransferase [Archangium sp.]